MKPKYAPELEELMRVKDGSLDESPLNIEIKKTDAINNYRKRQEEFSVKGVQSSFNKKKNRSATGFFGSVINEIGSFVDEVKKEIEKEANKRS